MVLKIETNPFGKSLRSGDHHYRAFVGPPENYDLAAALQFTLLASLGLRENHFLLDVGCGSLRAGKLFIPYLLPNHYFGIEPERWLIEEGIKNEIGEDLIRIKKPTLSNDDDFALTRFGQEFDFIIAQSVFSHASQKQIRRCLSQAFEVMKPSSYFIASFREGEEIYRGDHWLYPRCSTYTLCHMKGMAREQGLCCRPLDWPHQDLQTWVVFHRPQAQRNLLDALDPELMRFAQIESLEMHLRLYKDGLEKLAGHPYVKFGLKMKQCLGKLGKIFVRQ